MSSHGDLLYVLWNRIEARKHGRRDHFEPTGACSQKALGARVRENRTYDIRDILVSKGGYLDREEESLDPEVFVGGASETPLVVVLLLLHPETPSKN